MVRMLATLAFIGVAAGGAVYLAREPTIASGAVMAADLLGHLKDRGITRMDCDDRIPIGPSGARFHCTVGASDGSFARIQYTMDRAGQLKGAVVGAEGPIEPRVPTSSDPWGN